MPFCRERAEKHFLLIKSWTVNHFHYLFIMGYYYFPRLYHWGHLSLIVFLCLTEGRTSLGAERERKCKERWRRRARESADGRLWAGEWPWSERSPAGWKCTATEDDKGVLGQLNIFFSVCVHAPNCFLAYLCACTEALCVLWGPANPLWGLCDEQRTVQVCMSGNAITLVFIWGNSGF